MAITKPVQMPIVAVNKFSSVFAKFNSGLKKSSQGVKNFNKVLLRNSAIVAKTGQSLTRTGRAMKNFGRGATVGITAPLVAMGAIAVKAFSDMETGMQNIASLGVANDRIQQLKKDVSSLTEAVGKDTTDITGGLYQVVSAFGDTADTAKILEISAKGATAGLASTEEAINLTSAVTKAYGDTSAIAVQKVSDLAFQTVKLGQTTFPQLAQSIGEVTPLAKELGISQENLFGVFATATGVTGDASKVATQYKGVLSGLMSPTKGMTELYKKLGVSGGKDLIKKQGGIAQAMKLIVDEAKRTKRPLSEFLGNVRAQTLALAMAGPQYDTLIEKTQAMSNAQGASNAAFAEQMKAPAKQAAQLREMFVNLATDFGEIIVPALLDFGKTIKPMVQSLKNTSPEFKKMIVVGAAFAAILGPIVVGVGAVVTAFGSLLSAGASVMAFFASATSSVGIFGAVFSKLGFIVNIATKLFNPITLAITVFVGTLKVATSFLNKFFSNILKSRTAPKWIKNYALDWLNGFQLVKGFFDTFWRDFDTGINYIKTKLYDFTKFLGNIFEKITSSIGSVIPDWVKEGLGIKLTDETKQSLAGKPTNNTTTNTIRSEDITRSQQNIMVQKTMIQKQQQSVNVDFSNTPKDTIITSKGDNVANLNLGYVQ